MIAFARSSRVSFDFVEQSNAETLSVDVVTDYIGFVLQYFQERQRETGRLPFFSTKVSKEESVEFFLGRILDFQAYIVSNLFIHIQEVVQTGQDVVKDTREYRDATKEFVDAVVTYVDLLEGIRTSG